MNEAATQAANAASEAAQAANEAQMLVIGITVFVLAVFVGFEIITKVPPTLHTPLMSGSNAISGITVAGALILAGVQGADYLMTDWIGFIAVVFATINVVGGFMVTHRMLGMFQQKKK